MKDTERTMLHHKYSLADGHVTAQILNVEGYRGVFVTRKKKELRPVGKDVEVWSLGDIERKPDLLEKRRVVGMHVHHGTLASPFHFLKKELGLPLFVGFRGNDATAYPRKNAENLESLRKLFKLADRFFPVCEHLKREIMRLGCPEEKIRVLYGGVDLNRFEFRPRTVEADEKLRVLAVGRFVEKKGFDVLIQAFAELKRRREKAKLVLIGEGPLEPQYRKLIDRAGLGKSVKLIPWVDYRSIHEAYAKSHIFCAPSVTDANGNQEGIPNTLKEAMATGMPVVSTKHAGIPELVEHRKSGLLVPERDAKKLAEALVWMAEHPEWWSEFGGNARKKVERDFNLRTQLGKQKNFYDEVIGNRS
ncbi:glycosyltransferase [Paenibacillus sp.]|uniref:glycosyltransferase n=1 Tax=Paenibacillus sp. TaxID=58172 RepID=UPI002D3A8C7C|nr:glycosyltransferase [Paenibacillus sp.]HZG87124.1 glycosyltransferase [Paenibacillus sp.]